MEACDQLIANNRAAPMLKEISAAVSETAARLSARRMSGNAFANVMQGLANNNELADKELVGACMDLLQKLFKGNMPYHQFYQGCDYLDEVALINSKRSK